MLDIIFLVILAFFTAKGFMRGLIREMASIIGVILGFYVANTYYPELSPHLAKLISTPGYVHALSYFLLFIGTMAVISFTVWVITAFLKLAMLDTANHALGGVFGLAKGVILCAIVLLALDMFLPKAEFLTGSQIAPHLRVASTFLARFLPKDMQDMKDVKDKVIKKGSEAVLPEHLKGFADLALADVSKGGMPSEAQLAQIKEFLDKHPTARESLVKEVLARDPDSRDSAQGQAADQVSRLRELLAANPAFREALAKELAAAKAAQAETGAAGSAPGAHKDVSKDPAAPPKETAKAPAKPKAAGQ
jgi:membrane protein required for colicin V production